MKPRDMPPAPVSEPEAIERAIRALVAAGGVDRSFMRHLWENAANGWLREAKRIVRLQAEQVAEALED